MMWRFIRGGLGVTILLLAGSARPAAAGDQVPIRGFESGLVYVTGIPDPGNPDVVAITYTTEGIASHLGRYRFIGRNLADFVSGCTLDGEFVLVTANRDELHGTYDLCWDPTGSFYDETLVITGGTGRFDGATGLLHSDGIYTSKPPFPVSFIASWEGAISTVGSSKR